MLAKASMEAAAHGRSSDISIKLLKVQQWLKLTQFEQLKKLQQRPQKLLRAEAQARLLKNWLAQLFVIAKNTRSLEKD